MADITKCTGDGCPIKESCYCFTAPAGMYQSWFMEVPGTWGWRREEFADGTVFDHRAFQCDMYWGEAQDAIMDTLDKIVKGQ